MARRQIDYYLVRPSRSPDELFHQGVSTFLPAEMARDDGGFLRTGEDLGSEGGWPLERDPFSLETNVPGVFAAGDVRHGSMNRVASAVGEGSVAVRLVHDLFVADRLPPRQPA